jgi:hypothetical protein
MNLSTGLYRLAQVIKWIGRLLGGIWLIFSFTLLASDKAKVIDGFKNGDEFIWFIFVSPFVFIAITEVIAWVLEGFADD